MSKRWTLKEDRFVHQFFDALGDMIDCHDLGRPVGAARRRAVLLKRTGAWDALTREYEAGRDYRRCLGLPCMEDSDAPLPTSQEGESV